MPLRKLFRAQMMALIFFTPVVVFGQGHTNTFYKHTYGSEHKNIGNEIVYQIVVDRFANGNTQNDCPPEHNAFCGMSGDDSWFKYQGGDLRGIIQRLPYLAHLGVTRLWLTPVFENLMVTASEPRFGRTAEVTSYHGYWIKDWFRLNPFFTDQGSTDYATLEELINKAKAASGMKLYLDTVVNHTSPITASRWSLDRLESMTSLPQQPGVPRSYRGALYRDGQYLTSYDEDLFRKQQEPLYEPFFHQTGRNIGDVYGDSDWNHADIVQRYNLVGLADLDQSSSAVSSYMLDAHRFWLNKFPDLAGYRMDTIKHVSNDYWRAFSRDLYRDHPSTEILGEYYSAGPEVPLAVEFYRDTKMSMLDFGYRNALVDVFAHDQGFERISDIWAKDGAYGDASALFTYLDSHDHPRLRGQSGHPLSYERMRLAMMLLLTGRGVPVIYYGMEQDLHMPSDPGDPYNRPMMAQFDEHHDLYKLMQTLIDLRKKNPALRYGDTHVVHQSQNIFAFERIVGDNMVFVAVSKNRRSGADRFSMRNLTMPDGEYVDVLTKKRYHVRGGEMLVNLEYGDAIVLSR